MTSTRMTVAACGGLGVVLALGACTDINTRTTIGAVRDIPALEPAGPMPDDGARATRLDRSDWAPVEYRLPVDGTVHAPLWRSAPAFDDDPRRQHGLYPTAESALDLDGGAGERIALGFLEPVRAMADLAVLPVRMILEPVWDLEQSPTLYKRWRSGEWLAGPLPGTPAEMTPVPVGGAGGRDGAEP